MGWYYVITQEIREAFEGKDADVFAVINGFSQEGQGYFYGSLAQLSKFCGIKSKTTTQKILKSLIERGALVKEEEIRNGVKYCTYSVTKNWYTISETDTGISKIDMGGMPEIDTNNKYRKENINIPPYISKDIYSPNEKNSAKKRNPKEKKEYAEGVRLTEEEYGRLCQEYGRERADAAISYLSSYKIEKDYKTKDDNLTLRRWVFKAVDRDSMEIQKAGGTKKRSRLDDLQDTFDQIDRMFDGAQFTEDGKFIDEQ